MKAIFTILLSGIFICLINSCVMSQEKDIQVSNPEFEKKLRSLLSFTVPLISVQELAQCREDVILLDTREKKEYDVSHIPGAKWSGYDHFDISAYNDLDKDRPIVVYCSVGYRSERIGESFINAGFSNVRNLYGSLFEWVNHGYPVVDSIGQTTTQVHTYNSRWSRWMFNDSLSKKW